MCAITALRSHAILECDEKNELVVESFLVYILPTGGANPVAYPLDIYDCSVDNYKNLTTITRPIPIIIYPTTLR